MKKIIDFVLTLALLVAGTSIMQVSDDLSIMRLFIGYGCFWSATYVSDIVFKQKRD